uniref:Peroxisomal membrane protein PEX13 n=1 Tax=Timema monikensis TaxID=170555 RepID=A0A7R9EI78_9NEOP|nr:unnamed protein product [Timema monikensis]
MDTTRRVQTMPTAGVSQLGRREDISKYYKPNEEGNRGEPRSAKCQPGRKGNNLLRRVRISMGKTSTVALLDTGAVDNVFFGEFYRKLQENGLVQRVERCTLTCILANGQPLKVEEKAKVSLRIGPFTWPVWFLISPSLLTDAILGKKFIGNLGLKMDFQQEDVTFPFSTGLVVTLETIGSLGERLVSMVGDSTMVELVSQIEEFPDVVTSKVGCTDVMTHSIELDDPTPKSIIRRSSSPYASPCFLISKENKEGRPGLNSSAPVLTPMGTVPRPSAQPAPHVPRRNYMPPQTAGYGSYPVGMGSYGGYGGSGGFGGYGGSGGYGSYGGSGGYGGYGGSGGYGSYGGFGGFPGGYGMNRFGQMPSNDPENRFIRMAEDSTRPAFQTLESMVQAFGSVSFMMESTFHAVYNTFRAVMGVAEHLGRMRAVFGQVLSTVAIYRFLLWAYRKFLYILGLAQSNPNQEGLWKVAGTGTTEAGGQVMASASPRNRWPIIVYLLIVLGGPYFIWKKFLSKMSPQQASESKYWDPSKESAGKVYVMWDFQAASNQELSVRAGQTVYVAPKQYQPTSTREWILVSPDKQRMGLVPLNFLGAPSQRNKTAAASTCVNTCGPQTAEPAPLHTQNKEHIPPEKIGPLGDPEDATVLDNETVSSLSENTNQTYLDGVKKILGPQMTADDTSNIPQQVAAPTQHSKRESWT